MICEASKKALNRNSESRALRAFQSPVRAHVGHLKAARTALILCSHGATLLHDLNSQNRPLRSVARRLARPSGESARPSKDRTARHWKPRRCRTGWRRCLGVANQLWSRLPGVFQEARARADYSAGWWRQDYPSQGHQGGIAPRT